MTKSVNIKALDLRLDGKSYDDIAADLHITRPQALQAAFAGLPTFDPMAARPEDLGMLSVVRHEALTTSTWPAVERKEKGSARLLLEILNQFADMTNQAAPTRSKRAKGRPTYMAGLSFGELVKQAKRLNLPTPEDLQDPPPPVAE